MARKSSKPTCENADYYAATIRFVKGALNRASKAENVEWDIEALIAIRQQVETGMLDAILAMREADPEQASWTKIGKALGTSRQNAQQVISRHAARRAAETQAEVA